MIIGRRHERRHAKPTGFSLRLSFLFHVPRKHAWAIIVLGMGLTSAAEILTKHDIWFGPAYLLVIAFAAWSLNARISVGLGFLVILLHWVAVGFSFYPFGETAATWNFLMRFVAVLVIIGMLSLARRTLEREWLLARTDTLTGALNRQAFFETIESQVDEAGWYTLVYADLDGLKSLNDKKGHARGDQALKAFAEGVKNQIRKGDLFARIGGDEFVIFLRVKDEESGHVVAQRLNKAINGKAPANDLGLRCSLGVLILPPGPRGIDIELKLADKLMYNAKQSGAGLLTAVAQPRAGTINLPDSIELDNPDEMSPSLRVSDRHKPA